MSWLQFSRPDFLVFQLDSRVEVRGEQQSPLDPLHSVSAMGRQLGMMYAGLGMAIYGRGADLMKNLLEFITNGVGVREVGLHTPRLRLGGC